MPYLPELQEGYQTRTMTEIFGGYNRNLRINEGEWYHEKNLSARAYPLLAEREKRGMYHKGVQDITGIIAKDALAWVEGSTLYYNGYPVSGISLSTAEEDNPKQLVSMGAYLCIFPDNVYVNTQNLTDCGDMGAEFETVENAQVTYTPCRMDGTPYEGVTYRKARRKSRKTAYCGWMHPQTPMCSSSIPHLQACGRTSRRCM